LYLISRELELATRWLTVDWDPVKADEEVKAAAVDANREIAPMVYFIFSFVLKCNLRDVVELCGEDVPILLKQN